MFKRITPQTIADWGERIYIRFLELTKRFTSTQIMALLAIIVGVLAGLGTCLFELLLYGIKAGLTHWFPVEQSHFLFLFYPVIGIILASLFVKYVVKDNISEGVTRVLYAMSRKNSYIASHNCWTSVVGGATTIGFGGSVGPEAPIVLTGAAIGSNISRLAHLNYKNTTLLLCCEEGEEEYEKKALDNVTVVTVDDEDELTADFCRELEKKYRPKQVLIEYNGMWQMEKLYREVLPANWVLYQIMTFVYAPTFEMYAKNMGQLMMEKITNADMLVFNRCTPELRDALRKRNLRMVNRRADIYLEMEDGTSEDYLTGDECPFDLSQDLIDVPDDDFGVWYVDVMDHPDRWAGKMVHMKLIMCHSKKYPGIHCPGRFVMTCCENDIQFMGLIAKGMNLNQYQNRDWVEVTGRMAVEKHAAYKGKGPVMHVISIGPCEKPQQEVVTF